MTSAPIFSPEGVARFWGMNPALRSPVGLKHGACALWEFRGDCGVTEVVGDPDPQTHIISITAAGRPIQEYFADGRMRFRQKGRPGLLNIVLAGERPRAMLDGQQARFSYFHIYLPHIVLAELAAAEGLGEDAACIELIDPRASVDIGIEHLGRELLAELRQGAVLSRLRLDTLYQDLAIQLLRRHSNLASAAIGGQTARGGLAAWQLKRAKEAMEAHLSEDIGLDMLAGIAGCSPTHFSRAFKQSTGLPPFQWLLERRIERAKALLCDQHLPLAQIALAVGFAAQAQFTTAFKRATGATPGAWRREQML